MKTSRPGLRNLFAIAAMGGGMLNAGSASAALYSHPPSECTTYDPDNMTNAAEWTNGASFTVTNGDVVVCPVVRINSRAIQTVSVTTSGSYASQRLRTYSNDGDRVRTLAPDNVIPDPNGKTTFQWTHLDLNGSPVDYGVIRLDAQSSAKVYGYYIIYDD